MVAPLPALRGTLATGDLPLQPGASTAFAAQGSTMELTRAEAKIIYYRNMVVLLLSLVVGSSTLAAILSDWRHVRYNPVRKFANTLVAVLLGIEMLSTVFWLIGVNIAGAEDGSAPWKPLSTERADRLCFPISIVSFWLDPMIFLWHAIMAYFIWAWVVRGKDVGVLQKQILWAFVTASLASAILTLFPALNHNLGLWPHSDCFVRNSWSGSHFPAIGVMIDRFVLLPLSWLAIFAFNTWTVVHLRRQTQPLLALPSVKRLQLRLVSITALFTVIWAMMSIPLYLNTRTFPLELSVKWAFSIGFVDAMIYGYRGTTSCFAPCRRWLRGLRRSFISLFWTPEERQRREQEMARSHLPSSFWETFISGAGGTSPGSYGQAASSAYWHPARLPRSLPTDRCTGVGSSRPSLLTRQSSSRGGVAHSPLRPYHIFATTFDTNFRGLPLHGHGGEREYDGSQVPSISGPSCDLDPTLQQGLAVWIPSPASMTEPYDLYVIAVQRCRFVGRLRQALQEHLGGSGHYVLAGSAEIGDAISGRTAILCFARTVDVESGALRLLAANQRPVTLRSGVRGGVKGVLGMAFNYYDTTIAVINAHFPATSLYAVSNARSPLEARDKHIESMFHEMRIGAGNRSFDAHLQYHHVILLGNLNYRSRVSPVEMIQHIQHGSIACQTQYEEERELLRGGAGLEWNWRRGAGYRRLWSLRDPEDMERPDAAAFLHGRRSSDVGGWGVEQSGAASRPDMPLQPRLLEGAWAWVKEQNVLSQRIAKGLVLHGFREAPISFPPTFKWRVGASAEDYTERDVLEAAYVTGPRRADAQPQWSPSYTDRILVHSLDDIKHRAVLGPYDLCDEGPLAVISDHRPVSLALAVVVDTSQLPSFDDLGRRSRRRRARASSDTANAMAMAATLRRGEQPHARARSFWRVEQLLPRLQPQLSSGPRAFPLLVCLTFSRFRFTFRGFDVLRDEHTLPEACAPSPTEGGGEEIAKEAREQQDVGETKFAEDMPPPPPPPPPRSTSAKPSWSKWRRLPSFVGGSGGASGRSLAPPSASPREADEELPTLVDHVVILYPLPCEDPLVSVRRAHQMGESLQAVPNAEALERRSSRQASVGEMGGGQGRAPSHGGLSPIGRMLINERTVPWQHSYEAAEGSRAARDRQPSCAPAMVDEKCEDPGRLATTEESVTMEVLTLGPSRSMQHALIKFVGKRGKELGQGVFCVGELLRSPTGQSYFSRCATHAELRRLSPPSVVASLGGASSGAVLAKHFVELTVGGHFKGTVSFDLTIKAKRQAAREGVALRESMRQASGGSGSGGGGAAAREGGGEGGGGRR